jgi:hypothetical protein
MIMAGEWRGRGHGSMSEGDEMVKVKIAWHLIA